MSNWILFNDVTQSVGGADCLWLGMINADPANRGNHFVDLRRIAQVSPILFNDHQSRGLTDGFEQNLIAGALLHSLASEDILIPESMAHYVTGERTFRLSACPPEETRLWMLSGISGGISPWYHHIGSSLRDARQFSTSHDLFQWHERNESYLYRRSNCSNVGLLWSADNADFYGRDNVEERVAAPWRGFVLALERTPLLPVHLDDLRRHAPQLDALILPDIAAMSEDQLEILCGLIEGGMNVVITGQTSMLDEDGQTREDNPLLRLLGLTPHEGGITGTIQSSKDWENFTRHTYLSIENDQHEILAGFEEPSIIGFGGELQCFSSNGILHPIGSYIPAFPIYPPEFAWVRSIDSDKHPIWIGTLPGGARIVWLAADVDCCFGQYHYPDHGRLLKNAVQWVLNGKEIVHVYGPGRLIVSMYQQEARNILHLVNLNGQTGKPGFAEKPVPVANIQVVLPNYHNATVRTLVSNKDLPSLLANGNLSFVIDEILEHEVVVIEKA